MLAVAWVPQLVKQYSSRTLRHAGQQSRSIAVTVTRLMHDKMNIVLCSSESSSKCAFFSLQNGAPWHNMDVRGRSPGFQLETSTKNQTKKVQYVLRNFGSQLYKGLA